MNLRTDRAAVLAAAAMLTLAGCAGQRAMPQEAPLRGTLWSLPQVDAPEMSPPGRAAQIVIDPDLPRLTGFTGCNRLAGSVRLDGDTLVLGPTTTTRMACRPGDDDEVVFLQALAKVQRWQIEGRSLRLSDAAGRLLLRLQAEPDRRR